MAAGGQPMTEILPLPHFDAARFMAIAAGYTAREVYRVSQHESDARTTLRLSLVTLPEPALYRFTYHPEELDRYRALTPGAFSLGAYDGGELAGVALAERHEWNRTLWVWEFHVDPARQGRGVGRRLMAALAGRAAAAGLRAVVCETQNTNVGAIRFYRRLGFTLDGVDVSHYTNHDMEPGGTVAVFMKRRLP